MCKNRTIHKIFDLIINNKLLLESYKLDSDEFDSCNDKISMYYRKLHKILNLSYKQIDRIIVNILKRI